MKTNIYKTAILLLFSGLFFSLTAQPTVDVCLRKTATNLEVVITSNGSFTGLVSNIQLTIKCSDPTVTYGSPGDLQLFCTMARGGDEVVSGGVSYQKFGGIGFLTLTTLGISWATGTETVLFTIVPSSLTPTFEIVDDSWTASNNGAYYTELNALDKTGDIIICGATLPIEGLQLQVEKRSGQDVLLQWATEKEEVGSTFLVEKRGPNGGFSPLAELQANGSDSYEFVDSSPLHAVNYYQIRQINPNGNELLSNLVEIFSEGKTGFLLYPNPARDETLIQLGEINSAEKQVFLHNSLGQLVYSFKTTESQIRLKLKGLTEGIYHVKVEMLGEVWERKLVKL